MSGSKYDVKPLERSLKERLARGNPPVSSLADLNACSAPYYFAASSLVSVLPLEPFIFRSYELPIGCEVNFPLTSNYFFDGASSPDLFSVIRACHR